MSAVLPLNYTDSKLAGQVSARPTRRAHQGFSFGKYREIIIAVAFFLLFDLGVLILNFYTSYQIAEDALGVNLSGRQRMLSQRTAKALLSVQAARLAGTPAQAELDELQATVKMFDASLKGFQHGATVPGGDGKPVSLRAAEGATAERILSHAQALWTPYQERLAPVLGGHASDAELQAAVHYARANNLTLLGLMNELTTNLETVASDRATTLRLVQTGGIVLALLNFAFILFKFLGSLRTSDAAIEAANEENREILVSVREGLFLITPDFKLGSQLSKSAHQLFARPLAAGDDFFALLQPLVSEKALTDARDYVQLLFAAHIKESLVQGINPLSEVEMVVKNRLGLETRRHLSFHFNRVQEGGVVRHLLVTVQDISARIELEAKLNTERQRSQKEFAMLLRAFDADPAMLRQFVSRSESSLLQINDLLRSTASAPSEAAIGKSLDAAARRVHAIKGDAGTLGLDSVASQAHLFEADLQRVRQLVGASTDLGHALLSLPMPLEELLGKVGALKSLTGMQRSGFTPQGAGEAINSALAKLAARVAEDCGKRVQAQVRMGSADDLDATQGELVREIAVQLVRNAITHGIEVPMVRRAGAKPEQGTVQVTLTRADAEWTLSVRDDGAGLSATRVRQKLLDLGWYNAEQLESFDEKQIVSHIFRPGFSTAAEVSQHAGRGVGLDVVQANAQRLGARVLLSSTPGQFTEFKIRFTA